MSAENGQQPQRQLEDQDIVDLQLLLGSDGESRGLPSPFPVSESYPPRPEKSKKLPSFTQRLEELYKSNDEKPRILLESLHQESQKFTELNSQLREAKKDYLGCRYRLDLWYFGPSVFHMVNRLVNNNVSASTLPEAAALSLGMATGVLFFVNVTQEGEEIWKLFRKKKPLIKGLVGQLDHETKIIHTHLKLLGLQETREMRKPQSISWIANQIINFWTEKEIERQVLEKVQKN